MDAKCKYELTMLFLWTFPMAGSNQFDSAEKYCFWLLGKTHNVNAQAGQQNSSRRLTGLKLAK